MESWMDRSVDWSGRWTGALDWSDGLERWTGAVGGLEQSLDWSGSKVLAS